MPSTTVATITIGQSPRDDVVPAVRRILPSDVRILEYGALDGLNSDDVAGFSVRDGEVGIVTRLRDDSSVLLSHELILPKMQEKVDLVVERDHADVIVILCGADWSALKSPKLIVNPGQLFPAIVTALTAGKKLGVIKPDAGQVEREYQRYLDRGIDVAVTSASPYAGPDRLRLAREAGDYLQGEGCELIWMTCVGMDEDMRDAVHGVLPRPTILARSVLARIIAELVGEPASAAAPSAAKGVRA